jgi:hypothetical protein
VLEDPEVKAQDPHAREIKAMKSKYRLGGLKFNYSFRDIGKAVGSGI